MKRDRSDLARQLDELRALSREELIVHWQRAHGGLPQKGVRTDLLVRSHAWHLQARRSGGLSPATRRLLKAAMADLERRTSERREDSGGRAGGDGVQSSDTAGNAELAKPLRSRASIAPGARLVREWNGRNHIVDVIEGGFVFQAKVYRSLTAIAHQITGAHWSGPRFFGL